MRQSIETKSDTSTKTPYLYILMRSDLDSMNGGKAVAQGAHSANQFMYSVERAMGQAMDTDAYRYSEDGSTPPAELVSTENAQMYIDWAEQGRGFGTTITLSANEDELTGIITMAQRAGFLADITHDPSYPINDGGTVHLLPLDTCGYVFGDKEELAPLLRKIDLMW